MTVVTIVPPATAPVSLPQARLHLRVDAIGSPEYHPDDPLIESQILASTKLVEDYMNRRIMRQSLRLYLDCFTEVIRLGIGGQNPEITSVKYLDSSGTEQIITPSDYQFDPYFCSARLSPAYNKYWPISRDVMNAVYVDFDIGYSEVTDVPKDIYQAILLTLTHLYEHRGEETELPALPVSASSILTQYRVYA